VGKTFHFECPWCQYRVRISGGADSGVHCEVQTVVCRDCRELFDVATRVQKRELEKGEVVSGKFLRALRPEIPPVVLQNGSFHQLNTPVQPLVWHQFKLTCPVNAKHFVEPWNDPGRCPRCGNFMEKNGWPFRLWD
jgi:hypothetical protein